MGGAVADAEGFADYGFAEGGAVAVAVEIEHHPAIGGQEGADGAEHVEEKLVELPSLPVGAVAVCGGIEDYAVVDMAAPGLALREFHGVFHHPADVLQTGGVHVLPGPVHHLAHRVQMGDVCAGSPCGQRRPAGVREQIQHFGGADSSGFKAVSPQILCSRKPLLPGYAGIDVLPVRSLFREDAHVLESGEPQPHAQPEALAWILHEPLVGHLPEPFPGAAVFLAGLAESGSGLETHRGYPLPVSLAHGGCPEGLGLRAYHCVFAETLQFETVAAVEERVIFPFGFGELYHDILIIPVTKIRRILLDL